MLCNPTKTMQLPPCAEIDRKLIDGLQLAVIFIVS